MANVIFTIFYLFIFLYSLWWATKRIQTKSLQKKKAVPEAGGAWPLIGHLPLLRGPQPTHIALGNMADKYGPIFAIKMGMYQTLVVSSNELAKECFTTNDKAFAGRPKSLANEHLGYNGAMLGLSPYGSYWRQMRKIATLELLSNQSLEKLRDVREAEVRASAKGLYKIWEKRKSENNVVLVEMKRWFGDITLNVILKIIFGKSVTYIGMDDVEGGEDERWRNALGAFIDLFGKFVVADALPFLRRLDIGGYEKAMKKTRKELDLTVEAWLKEHKDKRASRAVKGEDKDFMNMMLSIIDDDARAFLGFDSDTINKATCLGLTLAASDSTAIAMTWAISLLLNNPDVLKRAQSELDEHVGRERKITELDVTNLVYLKAIIKETLRLYPPAPLSLPHEAMEDITIGDYHIPTGTRLLVNVWKIQRDSTVWSNPSEFLPERFLTTHKDIDVKGQNFELMPFGGGRRICPGISFAFHIMQLTLATLLHGFDFVTPSDQPIDMSESIGLINVKATPLEVLLNPRLPSHLYE